MTIIEQLEAVQGEMATLKASLETNAAAIVAKDREIEGLKGQLNDLQAAKDGIESAHATAIADVQAKLDAEIKAHGEAKSLLDAAERKLKDPAFAMASVKGDAVAVPDGGSVSGAEPVKSKSEQLKEIQDPKARRAFYLANEKEIKAGL